MVDRIVTYMGASFPFFSGWDANEGRDYDDVWPPAPARRDTAAFRTSCEDKL